MLDPRVQAALDKGTPIQCPCCEQRVHLHPRRIHKSMLQLLRYIATCQGISAKNLESATAKTCRDYPTLQYFGLTRQDATTKFWHVTTKGHEFLAGNAAIPEHVHVFNNRVFDVSVKLVTISDCQARFDKAELLRQNRERRKHVTVDSVLTEHPPA